jgi:hypothetical protein
VKSSGGGPLVRRFGGSAVRRFGGSATKKNGTSEDHRRPESRARGRTLLQSLVPDLGGLPRPFWVLFAGTFVNRVGGFVLIFLAIYLTDARGLSPAQAGTVVAAYGLGAIGAGPIGGALADVIGRRPTLVASLIGGGASIVVLGLMTRPSRPGSSCSEPPVSRRNGWRPAERTGSLERVSTARKKTSQSPQRSRSVLNSVRSLNSVANQRSAAFSFSP